MQTNKANMIIELYNHTLELQEGDNDVEETNAVECLKETLGRTIQLLISNTSLLIHSQS